MLPAECLPPTSSEPLIGGDRAGVERRRQADGAAFTSAAAKLARPTSDRGGQPRPAAGPAADVGGLEQLLSEPVGPVGQEQRAGHRLASDQRPAGPDHELDRPDHPRAEIRPSEERPGAEDRLDRNGRCRAGWRSARRPGR